TDDKFQFTAFLTAAGLDSQSLVLDLSVYNGIITQWTLESSYVDSSDSRQTEDTTDTFSDNVTTSNAYYHFNDIFVETAADLPDAISSPNYQYGAWTTNNLTNLTSIGIDWDFDDFAITASGQAGNGRLVTGYIGNRLWGQPIRIRVFVTAWTFIDIRKEVAENTYQIMDTTKVFIFSLMNNASAINSFQLVLRKSNPLPSGPNSTQAAVAVVTKIFYPHEMSKGDYHMIWDMTALNMLASNPDSEITASVSLGNKAGLSKLTISGVVKYRYDMPVVTELEFSAYDEWVGKGVSGEAAIVVNPLSPVFVTVARAYGTRGELFDVLLGEVSVAWPAEFFDANSKAILDQYLKGGVRRVNVTLTLDIEGKQIVRQFVVMAVFLDMSPDTQQSVVASQADALKSVTSFNIRVSYQTTTYDGAVNPYRDSYTSAVIDLLNFGVEKILEVSSPNTYEIEISNIKWSTTYVDDDGNIKNIAGIQGTIYVYAMECQIDGRTYNCVNYFAVAVKKS
ncbi:MAG: hypothetical protein LBE09_08645, partial [Christensenellaceae bacterium]|nr:hypothetical protein [Christensenellaceae bacterium]